MNTNAKDYRNFCGLLEITPPPKTRVAEMERTLRNWLVLHPVLAEMAPTQESLRRCGHYMHMEMAREEGPRPHIMNRLYKRYSNLRREIETTAMSMLVAYEEELSE
jgi:hypothetical protein